MEEDILRAWVDEAKWASIFEKDQVSVQLGLEKYIRHQADTYIQLRADILAGRSFAGFKEHIIDFAPYVDSTVAPS